MIVDYNHFNFWWYILVYVIIVFLWNFYSEENELSSLWNTERILTSETPKIVSDQSKYL